jgi:hypothetical protein
MEVVANSFILKIISKIDIFKLVLGDNLTGPVDLSGKKQVKIVIKDVFIKKYLNITNNIIYRYGNIGSLKFYQDSSLANHELCVFKDDEIFEIEIDIDELRHNPKSYLSEIIKNIVENNDDNYDNQSYNIELKGKKFSNIEDEKETESNKYLSKDDLIKKFVNNRKNIETEEKIPDSVAQKMRKNMENSLNKIK